MSLLVGVHFSSFIVMQGGLCEIVLSWAGLFVISKDSAYNLMLANLVVQNNILLRNQWHFLINCY